MKNFKNLLKRASAFALATVTAAVFMSGCGKVTPMQTIENGAEKLADNVSEKYSVIQTLNDAAKGGSVEIKLSLGEILEMAAGMNLDIAASIKTYFGEESAALRVAADYKNVNLVDAVLYETMDSVAIKSDVLTDGEAYGITFDGIAEKFAKSEFGEDGAYALPIDAESINQYLTILGSSVSMSKDIRDLLPELKAELYKAIEANTVNSVEKGTYEAAGTTVKTKNVSLVAEDDRIVDLAVAVIDVILNSEEIKAFCEKYSEILTVMTEEEDVYGLITEALTDAKEEAEDSRDEMDGKKIEVNAYIGSSSKELVAFEVELTGEDEDDDLKLEFVCAPSSAELEEVKLVIENAGFVQTVAFEVTEDTKDSYEAKLTAKDSDGTEITVLEYSWDRADKDFELTLGVDSTVTVKGEIEAGEKKSTITVDSVGSGAVSFEFEELAIIINASDKMPTIETFTDLLTMSADEIGEMIGTVSENIQDIIQTLG